MESTEMGQLSTWISRCKNTEKSLISKIHAEISSLTWDPGSLTSVARSLGTLEKTPKRQRDFGYKTDFDKNQNKNAEKQS